MGTEIVSLGPVRLIASSPFHNLEREPITSWNLCWNFFIYDSRLITEPFCGKMDRKKESRTLTPKYRIVKGNAVVERPLCPLNPHELRIVD